MLDYQKGGGAAYRLDPDEDDARESTFPEKLSETGCVDASDPTQPAESVIAYQGLCRTTQELQALGYPSWIARTHRKSPAVPPDDAPVLPATSLIRSSRSLRPGGAPTSSADCERLTLPFFSGPPAFLRTRLLPRTDSRVRLEP